MMVSVFGIETWYAVPDGTGCIDWDCDNGVIIVDHENSIHHRWGSSEFFWDDFRKEFPHRIRYDINLTLKHDVLEGSHDTDKLQQYFPKIFRRLVRRYGYEDKRI